MTAPPQAPCPQCGAATTLGAAFCGKCGAPLTPEALLARSNPAATMPIDAPATLPGAAAGTAGAAGASRGTTGGGALRTGESNEDFRLRLQEAIGDSYKLIEMLGRGGMGVVFRAREMALDREVALKILALDPRLAPDAYERFEREARLAAQLDHPNIVPIFSVGQRNGVAYYTMRLVRGGTVEEMIGHQRQMDVQQTVSILRDVAAALDYAHSRGVVHRDIKPANIMIGETGHAVVADFGIAKALGGRSGSHTGASLIGSPGYMSPEQWRGEEVDAKADQYALAVVAYEMLTGGRPFQALKIQDLVKLHLNADPPDITSRRPGLDVDVADAIKRGLAKDRTKRFPTATALVDAIAGGSVRTLGTTARHPKYVAAARPKKSRFGPLMVLALPIAAAAAVIAYPESRRALEAWIAELTGTAPAPDPTHSVRDSLLERDIAAVLSDTGSRSDATSRADRMTPDSATVGLPALATGPGVVLDTSLLTRARPIGGSAFRIVDSFLDVRVYGGAAQIRIDGRNVGFSNRIVRVEPGTHIVSMLGDFWPTQREINVGEGDTLRLNFYAPGAERPPGDTIGIPPQPPGAPASSPIPAADTTVAPLPARDTAPASPRP